VPQSWLKPEQRQLMLTSLCLSNVELSSLCKNSNEFETQAIEEFRRIKAREFSPARVTDTSTRFMPL
jgi:hypothetical protein